MPGDDPAIGLRYELTIDACRLGTFTAVEGLDAEYEVLEWTEGGNNSFIHRFPGHLKYGNIKLTRAVDRDSGRLAAWFSDYGRDMTPTTASISVQDGNKKEIARWNLVSAWPVKYQGPSLSSGTEAVATEVVEIAHDGFAFRAERPGTAMSLTKAYLAEKGGGARLTFMFNPKEVMITKSSSWKDAQSRGAKKAPKKEFVGTNGRTLTMELLFDGRPSSQGDVSPSIAKLFDWTCPTKDSMSANKPQPAPVILHWGSQAWFEGYVKQVNATYTLFDDQGTPLRANAKITLEELPVEAENQNPTSGGMPGHRTYRTVAGDTLQVIAYREYHRPGYWRALAETNGIDDPLRLRPGTTILIPPQTDAARHG